MRKRRRLTIISALMVIISNSSFAQKPAGPEQDIDRVVVGTNEVLLDVVVRDKKGHTIKDLQSGDFEVLEDGARQNVKSFRLVTSETTAAAKPATPPDATTNQPAVPSSPKPPAVINTTRIGTIAMVFDRLSPEARSIARQAALSYLSNGLRADDAVGVFRIDLSLQAMQRFTNSEPLVRQGIDRALSHASSTYKSATEQISNLAEQQAAAENTISQSAATAGPGSDPGSTIGAAAADAQFAQMTQNILEGFERLEQNQQGYATTDGLLAIISEMAKLPGRKALIFFSEGVVLPTTVMTNYRSIISSANRANVSIYSVDAAGLRSTSSDVAAGVALTKLGQARARVANSNADPFGSMMKDLERNEELMRSNPDSALGDLARETGGLLIANTNNPGAYLRQVSEDLHSYYILSYTSTNQNYDGKYRQIAIKVDRPGVDVQGRKGYFALNDSYGTPVLDYEAPALAILGGQRQANAFPSYVAGFSFPESQRPGLVSVMVEAPAGSVSFVTNEAKKSFASNFSIVVLIKDESQRVVRKLSNQYLLGNTLNKLPSAKQGKILFYKETALDPGRYTIAAVVHDAVSGHSSTSTASLIVPPTRSGDLQLSSLVIIKSAERLAKAQQSDNPLHFDEVLLYPNLGEPLRRSATSNLTLFLTVYPPKGETATPKLNLELMRNDRAVGSFSYDLPAADEKGRIQYAAAIPLSKLEPGEYEVKVEVQEGQHRATSSERVRIAP